MQVNLKIPQKVYHYENTKMKNDHGFDRYVIDDSVTLRTKEKEFIGKNLTEQMSLNFEWTDEYFPEDTIVPNKYQDSVFTNYNFSKQYPKGIWAFSLPIFLKEKPLCILTHVYVSGVQGGHHAIALYRYRNGHWEYFGDLEGGAW